MNYKIGDKASHFMKCHKVGTVVDFVYVKTNNQWSTGGSFENKIYVVLKYDDNTTEQIIKSDLVKVF